MLFAKGHVSLSLCCAQNTGGVIRGARPFPKGQRPLSTPRQCGIPPSQPPVTTTG